MLSVFEILSINTVLVTALMGIWTIFLRREVTKSLSKFKAVLKDYEKQKATDLFEKIRNAEKEKDVRKAMDRISDYTESWAYISEAVSVLKSKEDQIYKYGKYAIAFFAITFLFALYTATEPEAILTGYITRIGFLHFLLALEILLIFYWIWIVFDFGKILTEFSEAESESIEKRIMRVVEDIKTKDESSPL